MAYTTIVLPISNDPRQASPYLNVNNGSSDDEYELIVVIYSSIPPTNGPENPTTSATLFNKT